MLFNFSAFWIILHNIYLCSNFAPYIYKYIYEFCSIYICMNYFLDSLFIPKVILQIISEKILFTCFTLNLVQFYQIFSNIYIVQNLSTFILITPTYCPGLVSCIYVFYRLWTSFPTYVTLSYFTSLGTLK